MRSRPEDTATIKVLLLLTSSIFLLLSCNKADNEQATSKIEGINKDSDLKIICPEFKNGEGIPEKYTCMGENISPPFVMSGVPDETKSLALILDDIYAPGETFVHWMIFNIPPDVHRLEADFDNSPEARTLSVRAGQLYIGPCPPLGETHYYYFRLYALDTLFATDDSHDEAIVTGDLAIEMKGHILAEATYTGRFSRNKLITF